MRLELTGIAAGGEAVGRLDGQVVFVYGGIPGETVDAAVLSVKRSFLRARTTEVVTPSPWRVQPRCSYVGRCGGCDWQHIASAHQATLKTQIAREQLQRIGRVDPVLVRDCLAASEAFGYRSTVRFHLRGRVPGLLGYSSRTVVFVDRCEVATEPINDWLRDGDRSELPETDVDVVVRGSARTGKLAVAPVLREHQRRALELEAWEEEVAGRRYHVSPYAFFQANPPAADLLVEVVREGLAGGPRDLLVDAYAGVGLFCAAVGGDYTRVLAIEADRNAVSDATFNTFGLQAVQPVHGDVATALAKLGLRGGSLIADPPRAGMTPEALAAVLHMRPVVIAAVSCDVATLARDLERLGAAGYRVEWVQPVDMFPQTHHFELVARLVDAAG